MTDEREEVPAAGRCRIGGRGITDGHNPLWSDEPTGPDLLPFLTVGETSADAVLDDLLDPIALALSGAWGVERPAFSNWCSRRSSAAPKPIATAPAHVSRVGRSMWNRRLQRRDDYRSGPAAVLAHPRGPGRQSWRPEPSADRRAGHARLRESKVTAGAW